MDTEARAVAPCSGTSGRSSRRAAATTWRRPIPQSGTSPSPVPPPRQHDAAAYAVGSWCSSCVSRLTPERHYNAREGPIVQDACGVVSGICAGGLDSGALPQGPALPCTQQKRRGLSSSSPLTGPGAVAKPQRYGAETPGCPSVLWMQGASLLLISLSASLKIQRARPSSPACSTHNGVAV